MNCEPNMLMSFRNMVSVWTSYWTSKTWTSNIQVGVIPGTGQCLDVSGDGGPGSKAFVTTCNGGARQKWYYDDIQRLHPVYNPNLCLEIGAWNDENYATVNVWSCNGGANQQWYIPCANIDQLYCTAM